MAFKRRMVREKAMQALYAFELSHEPIDLIIENIVAELQKDPAAFDFAKELIYKVIESSNEIDAMIKKHVEHWELSRLAIVDKTILQVAICELLYFEDIPPKVSINEAIEIARRFSTDKSDKFVNGVLDSVLEDLKENGKLKKTGRGLLETSTKKKSSG